MMSAGLSHRATPMSLPASSEDPLRAERAAEISRRFNFAAAMADYCGLIRELAQTPD